jgi:hypothetical protein
MKRLIAPLAVALAVGCSDRTAPTELPFGPNFNQAPVTFTFPVAFTAFNACIGGPDDFFGTATQRVHFFVIGDESQHHFNITTRFELESAAGFSGFSVQQDVDNGTEFGPDEEFSFLSALNVNMSNESGQRLKVHIVFHITIRNGVVVRSLVDRFSIDCVGVPNG